jgi:hypothetical protein
MLNDGGLVLPNLLIVGAPKCGTTTLHEVLSKHSDIFMSRAKEPGFFSDDRRYARGLDWYSSEFFTKSSDCAFRGESTPWYLYSQSSPERAWRDLGPETRLIVALRNPLDRAISMYWDQVQLGREVRPIDEALTAELRGSPADDPRQAYVSGGRYSLYLRGWLSSFPAEQLHVVLFERLVRDPSEELSRLFEFLGVPPEGLTDRDIPHANPSGGTRFTAVQRAILMLEQLPPSVRANVSRLLGSERIMRSVGIVRRWNARAASPHRPQPAAATMRSMSRLLPTEAAALRHLLAIEVDQEWGLDTGRGGG